MQERSVDYYEHPIFHPLRLHLDTPPMQKLREVVHQWLWTGATGGLIMGGARVGKTFAVRGLVTNIKTRGGQNIPTYYISIPDRDQRTINSVFRQLCYSASLRVTSHDRADNLSDRYVQYVADRAVEENCDYAVLIVDEMQRLYPAQFNPFAELYDKLLLLGISLTVIFVGNEQESSKVIEQIQHPRYAHIHGRFFTQGHTFYGLRSKDEVKYCLRQYDTLRFPAGGPTYTEYFLPGDFKNRWRLASLSSDLWRVFSVYQKSYAISSWGMKFFTATIHPLLTDFLPSFGVSQVDDEMIHEAIRLSGLIPSLVRPVR